MENFYETPDLPGEVWDIPKEPHFINFENLMEEVKQEFPNAPTVAWTNIYVPERETDGELQRALDSKREHLPYFLGLNGTINMIEILKGDSRVIAWAPIGTVENLGLIETPYIK